MTQAAPQASAAVSPAKPPRNVTFTFCDSDDNNAVYALESNSDYEEGDSSQPVFIMTNVAESEIHNIICNYKKGIADSSITKVNLPNDRIYFKAKLMAAVDEAAATYKETIL